MRRLGLCGVLLLAAVWVAPAHGQTELAWKWTKDGEFYVRTETKVQQTFVVEDPRGDVPAPSARLGSVVGALALAGAGKATTRNTSNDREVRQGFAQIAYLRYKVLEINKDGSARVSQQIVKELKVAKDPPEKGEDDTPKDDELLGPPEPGKPGAELILHVKASGEVTKVEGQEKLLKLLGTDSGKQQALKEALSEESLKKTLSESLGFLPGKKVKAGNTWKRTAKLNLGPLGSFEVQHDYSYEGKEKQLDRLTRTTQLLNFIPSKGDTLAFRVLDGRFRVARGEGTFDFDADKGRLVKGSTSMNLEGTLTIRNGDKTYRTRLVQQQSTTTTVMDKLPEK
jgi:hypothetical protein